jgi:hypothetical protein
MAVGPDSTEGQAGVYSVAVAVDGGKRWAIRFQTPRMEPGPVVSCGSATSCTMAGNLAPSDQPITYWTTDGGASWHLTQVPSGTDILTGISCATAKVCAITGITGAPTAEQTERVAITFDHGAKWVVHYLPMGLQVIVDRASPSQCYLAGQACDKGQRHPFLFFCCPPVPSVRSPLAGALGRKSGGSRRWADVADLRLGPAFPGQM